jgi:nitrate reductase assembly molybdenum cofactor insertion protein NarJ
VAEPPGDVWESDDCFRRTVVLPIVLAERLAAQAGRRGLSVSDLLSEYAEQGLQHDAGEEPAG